MIHPPRFALISAWDKTGVVEQASILKEIGWTLISTGGTARALTDAGLEVIEITDLTGEPERFDGRVKTLHPAIHASILARRGVISDMNELTRSSWTPIDLVHVDLYPFNDNSENTPLTEAVELMRGKVGSSIEITVRRKSVKKSIIFNITRGTV